MLGAHFSPVPEPKQSQMKVRQSATAQGCLVRYNKTTAKCRSLPEGENTSLSVTILLGEAGDLVDARRPRNMNRPIAVARAWSLGKPTTANEGRVETGCCQHRLERGRNLGDSTPRTCRQVRDTSATGGILRRVRTPQGQEPLKNETAAAQQARPVYSAEIDNLILRCIGPHQTAPPQTFTGMCA